MLDFFDGDPAPANAFTVPGFDFMAWLGRHPATRVDEIVDSVVAALKASGVTRIGTTAYCFGALWALRLAREGSSQVTVLAHPSRVKVPEDLEVRFVMLLRSWRAVYSLHATFTFIEI